MTRASGNRAARRAAAKGSKRMAIRRRHADTPYLYPDIPALDPGQNFYPLKAFAVSLELMPALGPRLFLDGPNAATGTINTLNGPADTDSFRIGLPLAKLREFLAGEEAARAACPITLDGPVIPAGFTFGLLDIVTYPFWFSLFHPAQPHHDGNGGLADTMWRVNSNLLNHFYPSLRRFSGVLTIPHFDEEPIDDAPFHNIVLWPQMAGDADAIHGRLSELLAASVPTHYVCRERPIMDDRYALHQRRSDDGPPFNLLPLLDIAQDG